MLSFFILMKQPMAEIITEAHKSMTVIFSHPTNGLHKILDRRNIVSIFHELLLFPIVCLVHSDSILPHPDC